MVDEGNAFSDENLRRKKQRTPTVLILDTSSSMCNNMMDGTGTERIDYLNEGLEYFQEEISNKGHTEKRIDVSIVTFGGSAKVKHEFTQFENWTPPNLYASGTTPMADAIEKAIDRVRGVKDHYQDEAINYSRPFIWLLSDGRPDMDKGSDRWNAVQKQLEVGTEENRFRFHAIGIGNEAVSKLNQLVEPTGFEATKMKPGKFEEYFEFVSNSLDADEYADRSGFDQI